MTLVARGALGHPGTFVTPPMQEMLGRLDPSTGLAISYQPGWCDEPRSRAIANGGKMIRPTLAILGAEDCGADPDDAACRRAGGIGAQLFAGARRSGALRTSSPSRRGVGAGANTSAVLAIEVVECASIPTARPRSCTPSPATLLDRQSQMTITTAYQPFRDDSRCRP
jgi:hypothetical protein